MYRENRALYTRTYQLENWRHYFYFNFICCFFLFFLQPKFVQSFRIFLFALSTCVCVCVDVRWINITCIFCLRYVLSIHGRTKWEKESVASERYTRCMCFFFYFSLHERVIRIWHHWIGEEKKNARIIRFANIYRMKISRKMFLFT